MRLVRAGRIVADQYVRVLDDAPIPDGVPVIVPAARFLADAAEITRRDAPTGVLWPNNRRASELAPYLDQLALVALVFPNFKDGRAYVQAGAGIVADSVPEREHLECLNKARGMFQALRSAEDL